jgi:hypothetical protein
MLRALRWLGLCLLCGAGAAVPACATGEPTLESDEGAHASQRRPWGRFEVKRENTSRGTPEESTKTTLRLEKFLEGPVAVLRLDLPLPDATTDFEGSAFDPRLGDIKVRARFRAVPAGRYTFSSYVEATFPTANPESLGGGKYQLSGAVRMVVPLGASFFEEPKAHKSQFESELSQVVSVAGDTARSNINYTKLELTWYDVWREKYTFKLKAKPTADWTQDGRTGAVGEIEGGLFFGEGWRTWLMLGHRLWGPDSIKGTYNSRLELGITRLF